MIMAMFAGCQKKEGGGSQEPPPPVNPPFNIDDLADTYPAIAPFAYYSKWGPYNVHDPSIIKSGGYYYSYSTDAAYGTAVRPGIQVRKSKDLVEWQFVGWVFNALPAACANFISQAGGIPNQSLWAPYVLKVGNQFRLYYSMASNIGRLSVIGLATASSPEGPWTEQGIVVASKADAATQTNAIDPSVIVSPQGEHWMYYGSAWDGIYILKLNAATGLAATNSDKGVRIAQRGFTGASINGNIEAPEIIYHDNKYYLFIAYDWLETKYNVRVGRSNSPHGPFLDFNGRDLNLEEDHGPMILAPYQFQGHGGWQGVSHCSVFEDSGQYYMAHQGRPSVDKYFMVMHVRKLFWTSDGWPVVSPERFARVPQAPVTKNELTGNWEQLVLGYRVVPGYAAEQVSADLQTATTVSLNADTLKYNAPWLEFTWGKVYVSRERDWENKKVTLVYTGLTKDGVAIWGKRK
jgi:arabinan endo-1,5-alpha-L-arabinosidase